VRASMNVSSQVLISKLPVVAFGITADNDVTATFHLLLCRFMCNYMIPSIIYMQDVQVSKYPLNIVIISQSTSAVVDTLDV
jgi:hypothetical protein